MASYLKIANNAEQVAVSLNGQNITINSNPGSGTYLTASYNEADGTLEMGTNTNPNNAVVIGEKDNDINIDYPSGKQYELYSSADKPYLKVNSSYLPLTTQTGTVTGLKIKNGNTSYLPVQSTSASGSCETTTNTTISSWSGTKNEMTYSGDWILTTSLNELRIYTISLRASLTRMTLYDTYRFLPAIFADSMYVKGVLFKISMSTQYTATYDQVVSFRNANSITISNSTYKARFAQTKFTEKAQKTFTVHYSCVNESILDPPRYSTKTYYSPTQNESASISYPVNTTTQTTSSSSMSTTEVA